MDARQAELEFDLLSAIFGSKAMLVADRITDEPISNRQFDIEGLIEILPMLDEFSQEIVVSRFGLNQEPPRSIPQVSKALGVPTEKVHEVINLSLKLAYERDKTEEDLNVERIMKSLSYQEKVIIRVHFGLDKHWASDDETLAKQLRLDVDTLVKTREQVLDQFRKIGYKGH